MIRKKELWAFLLTSRLPPSLLFSVKQFYMIIISHIKKWFWTWILYFWSLLVTFRLMDDKTKSILLVEVYVDSVIYQKTKSNQKWPKEKYQGSKIFIDMADNNHIKSKIFYISLHQKYTFGLVVHKTKSNQKWPKVKY